MENIRNFFALRQQLAVGAGDGLQLYRQHHIHHHAHAGFTVFLHNHGQVVIRAQGNPYGLGFAGFDIRFTVKGDIL